jgi:hypothetical protein
MNSARWAWLAVSAKDGFCMAGIAVSGPLRLGPAVKPATSPHFGQAPAPPSKEKRQPQKHATSAITSTFFLCPRCRAALQCRLLRSAAARG